MGIRTTYEVQCDVCNESTEFVTAPSIKQAKIILQGQTRWTIKGKRWICPQCSYNAENKSEDKK